MNTNLKIIIIAVLIAVLFIVLQLLMLTTAQAGVLGCSQYATKKCVSNISYWYDSCGNIQALNQNCNTTNQLCSNGNCVSRGATNYDQQTSYIQNYRTNCYKDNVQWYDSKGAAQGIYQSCKATNSCTVGTCQDNACKSQLKCDGSTCAINSPDYITFCADNVQGAATTNITIGQTQNKGLIISLFGKKQAADTQWSKITDATNNDNIEFLITIKNVSNGAVSANASADITNNISYTGNLKIDGVDAAGSIVSGIDLGMLQPNVSRVIYFTGTVQSQNPQAIQVVARTTYNGITDSDFFTLNVGSSATATVSAAAVSTSPFIDFIKKWYLWIIIVIVLIALFVIIFRRLSTNP